MPLTAHEQRALAQIERDFHTDDPTVAAVHRRYEPRFYWARRLRRYGLMLLAGVVLLLLGVIIGQTAVGVAGFIVMVVAVTRAAPAARALCRHFLDGFRALSRPTSRSKSADPR